MLAASGAKLPQPGLRAQPRRLDQPRHLACLELRRRGSGSVSRGEQGADSILGIGHGLCGGRSGQGLPGLDLAAQSLQVCAKARPRFDSGAQGLSQAFPHDAFKFGWDGGGDRQRPLRRAMNQRVEECGGCLAGKRQNSGRQSHRGRRRKRKGRCGNPAVRPRACSGDM